MAKSTQPIIIKKVKKAAHAHHGGAWKIAYADFVTAMMAFFLLLWLLGATTETQRKGIADYFDASLVVSQNTSGANGVLGGKTIADPGSQSSPSAPLDPSHNSVPAQPEPKDQEESFSRSSDDAEAAPQSPADIECFVSPSIKVSCPSSTQISCRTKA